ncbi:unnamed protein product (macronuclear) [Paramecium tetraurelia]|uniref:Uncharacterized protein n=1 Tax=Paramecium tetraurelia TaxID=5888 RepID=A0DYI8_PARTE|nr:uncharacterized protein GSPATT00003073001 [Paramecium tetraurelia]CAK88105.1 unnamed protein product [Paramecium tetraurelia]|eukprot:XP_001455502.1 hypothetical protein (macronuclear) [Paramecium tetraurelia strain d4-2]
MNTSGSEIVKDKENLQKQKYSHNSLVQNIENSSINEENLKKKEKRNRKFFLKRSISMVQVCKQTGQIDLQLGSDFLHIEIMQGGHFPLNQYNFKDIPSEIYHDDQECQQANINYSLNTLSNSLLKKVRTIQSSLNCKSLTQIQQQLVNEPRQSFNIKENQITHSKNQYNFDRQQIKENKLISQQIKEAKQILLNQHQAFQLILQ